MTVKTTAEKIKNTIEKIAELQAVKRHYDSTLEELDSILDKKDRIETSMVKELEDINKLENLGVKSIFYKVLGSKEEQLEKERQEYLQVTLQHKEIVNALEVVEFEKNILEKKLVEIDQLEKELEDLKEVRETEILATPGNLRNELYLLSKKIDKEQRFSAELREAIVAGEATLDSLEIVYSHMKKARDWGNWDMVQNKGGRYPKSMKHNAIDRAMHELSRSKLLLRTFNNELRDVGYSNKRLAIQVEDIGRFPGVIFDNLISDWIVQSKIKSVLSTLETLMDNVDLMLKELQSDNANSKEEIGHLEHQKNKLLEEN